MRMKKLYLKNRSSIKLFGQTVSRVTELKNDQLLPLRLSRSLREVWRLIFEEFKKAFNLLTKADKFIFLKKWSPNADTPWN